MLVPIAAVRELLGSGTLLGFTIFPLAGDGGWFEPLTFVQKPAAAFIFLGIGVWLIRALKPTQAEKLEFELQPLQEAKR